MKYSILADMNLSPSTVTSLREYGFNIDRVSDILPMNSTDDKILEYAVKNNKIIITQDLDFSAILALRGLSAPTVVTLRLSDTRIDVVTKKIRSTWKQIENYLEGYAITITDKDIRFKKLPIII